MRSGLRHIATEPANLTLKCFAMADKKASPQLKNKAKSVPGTASDSEGSVESSPSVDSANDIVVPRTPPKENPAPAGKRGTRRGSEWEIVEGLRDGQRFEKKPDVFSGHLHKKRKWPLKGWHKRYFVVDKGMLIYGKSPADVGRGKLHGSVDIGLSVISTKHKRKRLDIDAEEFIYHLKAKTVDEFSKWVDMLTQHRLYRQHLLTFGTREVPSIRAQGASIDVTDSPTIKHREKLVAGDKESSPGTPTGSRLGTWVQDSHAVIESLTKELTQAAHNLVQLAKMQEQLELASHELEVQPTMDGFSPNVKKDRKKFGLRKKKSSKGSSNDLTGTSPCKGGDPEPSSPSAPGLSNTHSNSNTSLPSLVCSRPQSLVADEAGLSLDYRAGGTDNQLREDFAILAKDIHSSLKLCCYRLVSERDHLRSALMADSGTGSTNLTASLRSSLHQALQQNVELKCRLAKIHSTSDLSDITSIASENNIILPSGDKKVASNDPLGYVVRSLSPERERPCLSYSSSCISASEFFDAEEYQPDNHETSSEVNSLSSEENSTENSEADTEYTPPDETNMVGVITGGGTGRRTKLPVPRPDTEGLSLWNLLCKNIGQDLSQVSMPVALNEPLNMLQRMCEELEYSELLDKAAETDDRYERMVLIAAFAVSSYGSAYFRAGSKPFNPLLGETYECIREDRGFRFIAEQVSHHPPVSVCHAESRSFVFWQDARIKTKFWGKSMEFQPTGCVNLILPKFGDHYKWNKVTTCVHNLFSGQRWVDQYGELKISNGSLSCKLTFVKASYWSAKRHEVFGTVTNEDGKVVRKLFGKWSEALYCGVAPSARCIWRPGAMPEEYELYYGFSRFAMELNELETDMAKYLPATDTRFRPDQRLLEEGNLSAAESLKLQLEQSQRERRKRKEQANILHQPKWFRKCSDDSWESNGKYWECRKSPGFMNMQLEALW